MKSKIVWTGIIGAIAASLFFITSSAESVDQTDSIKKELLADGADVLSVEFENSNLKVELHTESDGSMATSEDIKGIRATRNVARMAANEDTIHSITVALKRDDGNSFYKETMNDIRNIPAFTAVPEVKLGNDESKKRLEQELSGHAVFPTAVEVADYALNGKRASVSFISDATAVNALIPQIEQWITQLNKGQGTGITQYDLNVYDDSKKLLVYLSADLVYKDTLWWQNPSLGSSTWTGHGPKTAEDTATNT
ncbi:hypothetical protein [Cohnella sp. 56]|uniref:hypothetical protein n=1 Tax=Cohnella sp. 56 TaxID=3113722 RepID=UPI0030E74DC6